MDHNGVWGSSHHTDIPDSGKKEQRSKWYAPAVFVGYLLSFLATALWHFFCSISLARHYSHRHTRGQEGWETKVVSPALPTQGPFLLKFRDSITKTGNKIIRVEANVNISQRLVSFFLCLFASTVNNTLPETYLLSCSHVWPSLWKGYILFKSQFTGHLSREAVPDTQAESSCVSMPQLPHSPRCVSSTSPLLDRTTQGQVKPDRGGGR